MKWPKITPGDYKVSYTPFHNIHQIQVDRVRVLRDGSQQVFNQVGNWQRVRVPYRLEGYTWEKI